MPAIPLNNLEAHPDNTNIMPAALLDKLVAHINETGNYPPIIVRPIEGDPQAHPLPGVGPRYQILDGHHRVLALQRLGRAEADCDIWNVDDKQAAMLLLTLNRLHGEDDPHKRGSLIARLQQSIGIETLAARLPDDRARIERLIAIAQPPPEDAIAPPQPLNEMPHAVTFFLSRTQRTALFAHLKKFDHDRSAALVKALELETPRETASES